MDFLKDEFLDQLRAEIDDTSGKVIIEAAEFTPQEILQEVNPTVFETTFSEWCENKRDDLIARADEILDLYDNRRRFNVLQEHYSRGAVIPFVGAGMSMPSGYSGWTAFLNRLLPETHVGPELFQQYLSEYKYEEAAQLIHDDMGARAFNEALENEFGLDQDMIAGAVRYLPSLFPSSVITTNFDNVLKRAYEKWGQPFSDVLLGSDAIELPRYLGQEKNVLVKLHGKATSGRNRVLLFNEYEQHYSEEGALQRCIKTISQKTLLFLGCSLGVDRTIQCLKNIVETERDDALSRHYAFLKQDEGENRVSRKQELAAANIFPIWYTGDHDEAIEALLVKLTEGQ